MFFVSLIRAGNLVKFKSCLPFQIGVLCPNGEINNIHVMVVLKILWLSLAFFESVLFCCLSNCSFESMSKLCERYNRAIDGILQLVSVSKHHAL